MPNYLEEQLSIDFTISELWFLLSQFGPAVILGMDNPYLGWLADEIISAQRQALLSLVDRDLVRIVSDQEISLDDTLADIVRTVTQPEHSLVVQAQDGRAPTRRYIHIQKNIIVEHLPLDDGQHRLTVFTDEETLAAYLGEFLHFNSPAKGTGKEFCLPEAVLFEARLLCTKQADDQELVLQRLTAAGLSQLEAKRLTAALSSPVANSAAVVVVNRNDNETQHVRGLAVLEGREEMWQMQPFERNGQSWVEFTPSNARLVRQKFLEMLP